MTNYLNSKYSDRSYWDARYTDKNYHEWFGNYAQLQHVISQYIIAEDSRILNLGCGNSSLASEIHACGQRYITNIDYSPTVIEQMRHHYSRSHPELKWLVMDVRKMSFSDGSFDVVIEKGTLDALLVGENPWQRTPQSLEEVNSIFREIIRLLVPNGVFISVTFTQPHFRLKDLCHPNLAWSVKLHRIDIGLEYFVYVMRKGEEPNHSKFSRLLQICCSEEDVEREKESRLLDSEDDMFLFNIQL